jgi:UDP-N-acetylmuramoyl-tripeptide--D-alanyl-D-alanine ligase
MRSLRERIAWYRAEQYLARYKPYGVAVAGTYGRELTSDAIVHALRSHRDVRSGYRVEHSMDIPEGILGAKSHKEHEGILRMLTRSKMRELTQYEPNTIVTQLPLLAPHAAPWALSRILPQMLVLTHVGLEYVDLFMNKDMIAHEYGILANTLSRDAVVVLNADDEELRQLIGNIHHPVITYGVHLKADVHISRAVRADDGKGIFLEVALHGKHHEVFLPHLFAKQHVSAIAASIAVAHGMGISPKDAMNGVRLMKPAQGTLARLEKKNGVVLIDDSYDTCPEQLESSLKTFATMKASGRKIIVMGDMDNLASFGIGAHEEAGRQSAAIAPIVIFIGDMMRHAQNAALQSGTKTDTHHFVSSSDAASWLPEQVREGDMVFVSGGKSMNMGKIITSLQR